MPHATPANLVDRSNSESFAGPLRATHADRGAAFVDLLNWDIAVTDDCFGIDQYDTEDTIYLMVLDATTDGHLGSVRLLRTDGPHLLADRFAALCEAGVPRAPDIFEITRMVTRPGLPADAAQRVREQLCVAIVEFGLARGLAGFTMVSQMASLAAALAVGWDCEPLGMPAQINGVAVAALRIAVDAGTLARLRAQFAFVEPVLRLDLSESALVV